jgi:hypothetical protein
MSQFVSFRIQRFIDVCWDEQTAAYAAALSQLHFKTLHILSALDGLAVAA